MNENLKVHNPTSVQTKKVMQRVAREECSADMWKSYLLVLEVMDETIGLLGFEKLCNKVGRFRVIIAGDGSGKGPLKQKLKN